MRYKEINNQLFVKNRNKLSNLMKDNSVSIVFSAQEMHRNGDQNFNYRQNSDFFYLTGVEQEHSVLTIAKINGKIKETLFILKPDKKTEIWEGKKLTKQNAIDISGIEKIVWNDKLDSSIINIIENTQNIYFQKDFKDERIKNLKKIVFKHKKTIKYLNVVNEITKLRLIKEPEEIELVKEAVEITRKAYIQVLKTIKPNKKEYEIEAEITYNFIKNAAGDHAYAPIVATGKNACSLHYVKNDDLIKNGELVLMDFGAEYANYAADLSRTIPANGTFTKRQKQLYNAVLDVQKRAIKLYVPGNTINNINEEVMDMMENKMIELGLFSEKDVENQNPDKPLFFKYFMHGTSHFMGLDVHDVGTKDTSFKENMILTCEPGIYIEEEGIGIRIENDIIVAKKPIDLMADFPREIDEIEKLMKKDNEK